MSAELRRLLAEAMPGPWTANSNPNWHGDRATIENADGGWYVLSSFVLKPVADAALIAAAVNALPALLDVVDAAREWAADDDRGCECSLCLTLAALDKLEPSHD